MKWITEGTHALGIDGYMLFLQETYRQQAK